MNSSATAPVLGVPTFCPAKKKTKIYSDTFYGLGSIKYTANINPTNVSVKFEKWWNGIPYWWSDSNFTTFTQLPGYVVVYATPPVDVYITVVESGL